MSLLFFFVSFQTKVNPCIIKEQYPLLNERERKRCGGDEITGFNSSAGCIQLDCSTEERDEHTGDKGGRERGGEGQGEEREREREL